MARIHWLGAGLSSVPGIRRLIQEGRTITLWNRTVAKAERAVNGLEGDFDVKAFSLDALAEAVQGGDVVVSMLPATMHIAVAELCLDKGVNFVSSSYISPEMSALGDKAKAANLVFVNEVGLDPGLDHLLAHLLMADYKGSAAFDASNSHDFRSYCGGFPAIANDFRYKFSWSPLGVLKALKSPAQSILGGDVVQTQKPWDAIADFEVTFPSGSETFQSYPNRDSLPFLDDYGFDKDWNMNTFVRGTLRLNGWSDAWADIFNFVENEIAGPDGEEKLTELSEELWNNHSYDEGEPDRVVLVVDMKASKDGRAVWHKSYALDARGNDDASAMARLVSIPVSLAIEAVLDGKMEAGVQAAPSNPAIIENWFAELSKYGDDFHLTDNLV
ncbi:saccharopine dehydrogenase family protein [Cohaesibacter gelatinilyticus]|uniref:Saccharopine dehydrogenase (NADP+, L-glutamate forming) n=1 Tax=Cohaesibacter gelatinilyticus TaxID=372072 RepID=A0A285NDF2_9HYPH|nr:saccharopine dehydrogenase family protein [Cohaesibacter gelatinilyticus]SNZ07485.1 saccharopine dehydrogenase (NADP+, L-glutamate forming) [Cohaesibacter gelatinilyticus]